jgi:NAD-dependent deacetylase
MPNVPRHFSDAVAALRSARRLVVFTGAGVSAESGIPTFRDGDGLWKRFPPEQFATPKGLLRTTLTRPALMAEFLYAVLEPVALARPGPAHKAIAALGQRLTTTVVTQNVDGLHTAAGSRPVHEIHGSFCELSILPGRRIRPFGRPALQLLLARLVRLKRGPLKFLRLLYAMRPWFGLGWTGFRRPRVVLFGERLAEPDWTRARAAVQECDVLLVVGTSGEVYPAAEIPALARKRGATVITVDPAEPGPAHVWVRGLAGEVLPRLVEEIAR